MRACLSVGLSVIQPVSISHSDSRIVWSSALRPQAVESSDDLTIGFAHFICANACLHHYRSNELGAEGVVALARVLHRLPQLQTLNLACAHANAFVKRVVHGLRVNAYMLRALMLTADPLTTHNPPSAHRGNRMGAAGLTALAHELHHLPQLRTLNLGWCALVMARPRARGIRRGVCVRLTRESRLSCVLWCVLACRRARTECAYSCLTPPCHLPFSPDSWHRLVIVFWPSCAYHARQESIGRSGKGAATHCVGAQRAPEKRDRGPAQLLVISLVTSVWKAGRSRDE